MSIEVVLEENPETERGIQASHIAYALVEGNYSFRAIEKDTGMRREDIKEFHTKDELKKFETNHAEQALEQALQEGAASVDELYAITGIKHSKIINYVKKHEVELQDSKLHAPSSTNKKIDRLWKKGYNTQKIADNTGLTRQRIHSYITRNNHLEAWKEAKKQYSIIKEEQEAFAQDMQEQLLRATFGALQEKARKEGKEYEQAINYIFSKKRHPPIRKRLVEAIHIFRDYNTSIKKGDRKGAWRLAKGRKTHVAIISRMLEPYK